MYSVSPLRAYQRAFGWLWSAALVGLAWSVYASSLHMLLVFAGLFVFSSLMLLGDLLDYLVHRYAIEDAANLRPSLSKNPPIENNLGLMNR